MLSVPDAPRPYSLVCIRAGLLLSTRATVLFTDSPTASTPGCWGCTHFYLSLDSSVPSTWVSSEHPPGRGSESGVQDNRGTGNVVETPAHPFQAGPELQDRLSWGEKAPHSLNDSLTPSRRKCSLNVYLRLCVCVFAAAFGEQASTSGGSGLEWAGAPVCRTVLGSCQPAPTPPQLLCAP